MLESAPDEICASPYGLGSDPVRTPSTINALPGSRPDLASGEDDLVEGPVELSVAAAVEPVADRLAGGGRDRGGAGEPGEGGLADETAAV
jgi:hypothetical protein